MDLPSNLAINSYSFIIILVLLLQARRHADSSSRESRMFEWTLVTTAFLLIFDTMGRFDGSPGTIYAYVNWAGNFLMYLLYPLLPALWLRYVHFQIHHDGPGLRQLTPAIIAVFLTNAALVVASQFSGWIYAIDEQNRYTRGPGFLMPAFLSFTILGIASGIVVFNRHRTEPRHYRALLLFAIPPAAGLVLQLLFFGASLLFAGVTFSLLVIYLEIQNQSLYIDHLTGVNNRRRLEHFLENRIRTVATEGTFAAIMLDIDNFKRINDTMGHDAGDTALETAVSLVRACIRSRDFMARYGGDEFYVVLDGVRMEKDLRTVVEKIEGATRRHNEAGTTPFRIDFSMGFAVYNPDSGMTMEDFLKHIDSLMYRNKRQKQLESLQLADVPLAD